MKELSRENKTKFSISWKVVWMKLMADFTMGSWTWGLTKGCAEVKPCREQVRNGGTAEIVSIIPRMRKRK